MTRREILHSLFLLQQPSPLPVPAMPAQDPRSEVEDIVRRLDTRVERLAEQLGVAHSQVLEQMNDRREDLKAIRQEQDEYAQRITDLIEKKC